MLKPRDRSRVVAGAYPAITRWKHLERGKVEMLGCVIDARLRGMARTAYRERSEHHARESAPFWGDMQKPCIGQEHVALASGQPLRDDRLKATCQRTRISRLVVRHPVGSLCNMFLPLTGYAKTPYHQLLRHRG